MDEAKRQMVLDAIAGLSVEEVQSLIESSVNASEASDPALLAGYLVAQVAA